MTDLLHSRCSVNSSKAALASMKVRQSTMAMNTSCTYVIIHPATCCCHAYRQSLSSLALNPVQSLWQAKRRTKMPRSVVMQRRQPCSACHHPSYGLTHSVLLCIGKHRTLVHDDREHVLLPFTRDWSTERDVDSRRRHHQVATAGCTTVAPWVAFRPPVP